MAAYCSQSDVYTYGLPRGALGNPGRLVDSSLASTSTITLNEHGFQTGDPFKVRATAGGSLSSPLVAGTTYYALRLDDSTFQVSATPTGGPITLTSDGVSVVVTADLPFDALCEFYSRWADSFLPAEAVPLAAPYPIIIVGIVAQLVAKKVQILSGMKSESMDEAEVAAGAQLKRYAAGIPVRGVAPTQVQTNLTITQAERHEVIGRPLWGHNRDGNPSDEGGFCP